MNGRASDEAKKNVLIGTLDGNIYVLKQLKEETFEILSQLENLLINGDPLIKNAEAFLSRHFRRRKIVMGDILERYSYLSLPQQQAVFNTLESEILRPKGMCLTVKQLQTVLEEHLK